MAIERRRNKDGSFSYRARIKDRSGKWFQAIWFREEAEAKSQEADFIKQKKQGAYAFSYEDAKTTTVKDYWEVWILENQAGVSEGWKISLRQMWRDYVEPVLGNMKIYEVQSPHVGRVLNRMIEIGRGPQTRKHVYTMMNKMFGDAVKYYRMITENPVMPHYHCPEVPEQEAAYLEPADLWKLLEKAKGHYCGPAVWLEGLSGLRTEAALPLQWKHVLWDRNQILVTRAWKQKVRRVEDYPKGKSAEHVPMPKPLKAYLETLWQKSRDLDAFVCQSKKGGMLKPETYAQNLKRLCREAGVPEISPHGLRHSCTELYTREGASERDVQELLTHKHASTTRRYLHRVGERLANITAKIQEPKYRRTGKGKVSVTHESYPRGKQNTFVKKEEGAK